MKRVLRSTLTTLVVIGGAIVVASALGMLLPRRHVAATSVVVHRPPGEVWDAISDIPSQPRWRSDLKSVQPLPPRGGHAVWLQHTDMGDWPLEFTEAVPPLRLVACVADSSQGFGGTWTYELTEAQDSTRITITERGFIDAPLYRFLARFVFGLHGAQETYLRDLGRHFGERVTPREEI